MFLTKNHASRVSEKITEARALTYDIPTYNMVHLYNLSSLWALSYAGALSMIQLNVKACMQNVPWK